MIEENEDARRARRATVPLAGVLNADRTSFPRRDVDALAAHVERLYDDLAQEVEKRRALDERVARLEGKVT